MTLTPEEHRAELERRKNAAVQRLTRTRQGAGPDLRIYNLLHLMDLKQHGYTKAHYRATCEYPGASQAWSEELAEEER